MLLAKLIFLLLFAPRLNKCQSSKQSLDCTDFDTSCQWLNAYPASAANSTLIWYRSTTVIDQDQMQMSTGTKLTPNGSYAITSTIGVDGPNATQRAVLISGVVPCQNSNATLNFNYWTSPFVQLTVCQKTENLLLNRSTDCRQGPVVQGPGPASIPIAATKNPFRILIEASNFVYSNGQLTGGFAIIGNVKYSGDFCVATTPSPANVTAAANSTGSMASGSPNSTIPSISVVNATAAAAAATTAMGAATTNATTASASG